MEEKSLTVRKSPETFWQFYNSVVRSAFGEFFSAKASVGKAVAVIFTIIAAFNKEIAEHLEAQWHSVSRWWAVLPVLLLLFWRLIVSNYRHFEDERSQRVKAEQTTKELVTSKQLQEEWRRLKAEFEECGGGSDANMVAFWNRDVTTNEMFWHLSQGWDQLSRDHFWKVMEEAGNLLLTSKFFLSDAPNAASEPEPVSRWLAAVCKASFESMKATGDAGTNGERLMEGGKIEDLPRKCILTCSHFAAKEGWPKPLSQ